MEIQKNRMKWWRYAKFGMFIHWGLYSIPAGQWKGETVPGIAGWIMERRQIPIAEYKKLAESFNPTAFDAKKWVSLAKEAGMKYIMITAKHHDGFAMYHSKVSSYNIVDATPFKKDIMKDLAKECEKQGIKLCFYYSQDQDWYEKDATGNNWDFNEDEKDLERYLEDKVKPQLRELLTNYGDIGIIWFDTPINITPEQSKDLADFVHRLQPECLVNGRVGNEKGDYMCFGDNETPAIIADEDWETVGTMNESWGYKKTDNSWKDSNTLIRLLIDIVSKGGVYVLNIGPTAEGIIPKESVKRLKEIGKWTKTNGEAVWGTKPSPYTYPEFEWGTITQKFGKLYIHLFEWHKNKFKLHGIKNKITKVYLMEKPEERLKAIQEYNEKMDCYSLQVSLPLRAYKEEVEVLVLEIQGEAQVDNRLIQQADLSIVLPSSRAKIHRATKNSSITMGKNGIASRWNNIDDWLSWEFIVFEAGRYDLEIMSLIEKPRTWFDEGIGIWEGEHQVKIELAGQIIECIIEEHERIADPRSLHFKKMRSKCGSITIDSPGTYSLNIKPIKINYEKELGIKLRSVNLRKRE